MPTDGYRCTVTFPTMVYGSGPTSHFGETIAVSKNKSAINVSKNHAKLRTVTIT